MSSEWIFIALTVVCLFISLLYVFIYPIYWRWLMKGKFNKEIARLEELEKRKEAPNV